MWLFIWYCFHISTLLLKNHHEEKKCSTTILPDKQVWIVWDSCYLIAKGRRGNLRKRNKQETPTTYHLSRLEVWASCLVTALQLSSAMFCQCWDKKNKVNLTRGFHFPGRSLDIVFFASVLQRVLQVSRPKYWKSHSNTYFLLSSYAIMM